MPDYEYRRERFGIMPLGSVFYWTPNPPRRIKMRGKHFQVLNFRDIPRPVDFVG
ncbi:MULTISPECIES: hypothetical protein [Agrobacterium]|uniref:hypothetical protein n=1 Tax=Agrobacterium TaxID=357 RepID=UPI0009724677|nr:hypothetical protein [Agrobacterium sp. DSM 25558]SCX03726.1 hypothetical protein DSM25558_0552 [Agrobacterium sp. DSM 25558]